MTTATARKSRKPAAPANPLDTLIAEANAGDLSSIVTLLFWKARFENPGFTVEITPRDLAGLNECAEYLDVVPTIRVFRPGGVPAVPERPHPRLAGRMIPGRPEIPPKELVVVQMTDAKGDAFVAVENNQQDRDRQIEENRKRTIRDNALSLAEALKRDVASGQFSTSNIQDAIAALTTLAR